MIKLKPSLRTSAVLKYFVISRKIIYLVATPTILYEVLFSLINVSA
tara:strand:- start:158 stop:295 length:138 start_codon:yes stop_codon:yes gene_type:complete